MTTKSLFYSLACALALSAAAAPAARADEDSVDCAKYPRKDLLEDVRNLVKITRNGPCAKADLKKIKLEGSLQQKDCGTDEEDCKGKSFRQNFSGHNIEGSVSVEWTHQRAGFMEWCQISMDDCRSGP